MYSLLLVIIYLAFISLGLPDSLLGSAWPIMYRQFDVPVSYAGVAAMIISAGTVVSSLLSDRMTKKFGAGLVTAVSVLLTAVALFGFSISRSFIALCLWSIPYGFGAGAVDAALNNYVALYYAPRHMSWLHCFWGVGAAISPYIMSYCLLNGFGWNIGYRSVSVIQIVLTAMLFISLPIWRRRVGDSGGDTPSKPLKLMQAVKIKGVKYVLITFFCYCTAESTAMLWASTYLVQQRGIDDEAAAEFASLFFLGITAGRFLCGFIAEKVGDKNLIRCGTAIITAGIILISLPVKADIFALAGLVIIGLGCAPVYPSLIHATPANFGEENSQAIIGIQMASAYIGTTFMPPIFGAIAEHISIGLFPLFLLIFTGLTFIMSEQLNKAVEMNTANL